MRKEYKISVKMPEGVQCEVSKGVVKAIKEGRSLEKNVSVPRTSIEVKEGGVVFYCSKANKKDIAVIKANVKHVKNLFEGVDRGFKYELEVCNVHFPMTVKVSGDKVVIGNFLGEKVDRTARILSGVNVDIKGNKITVEGTDIEKTGQTAANIEKASKVPRKDRRIFQDGIFLTSKPGGEI